MAAFRKLLILLQENGVEFVAVGGYASMLYGSPLMTQDVACRMTRENLLRLEKALTGLRPMHRQTAQKFPLDFSRQSSRQLEESLFSARTGASSTALGKSRASVISMLS